MGDYTRWTILERAHLELDDFATSPSNIIFFAVRRRYETARIIMCKIYFFSSRQRVSLNAVDSSGYSPLHFAAQANRASAIKILLGLDEQIGKEELLNTSNELSSNSTSSLSTAATITSSINSSRKSAKANPVLRNQVRSTKV